MQMMDHQRQMSMPPQYQSFPVTPGHPSPIPVAFQPGWAQQDVVKPADLIFPQELSAQKSMGLVAQELPNDEGSRWEMDGNGPPNK